MLKRIKKIFFKKNETELSVSEKIENLFCSPEESLFTVVIGEDIVKFSNSVRYIISEVREEIESECGFILPEVNIISSNNLQENEVQLLVRYENILSAFLIPNEEKIKEEMYDILKTAIYEHMDKIFTAELAQRYIDKVQLTNSLLIWNLTSILTIIDIRIILSDIITKGKSIKNINYVFERISENVIRKYEKCGYNHVIDAHSIANELSEHL